MITPTLRYRWENRFAAVLPASLLVAGGFFALRGVAAASLAFLLLVLVTAGFAWDVVYTLLQSLRWDYDWPPLYAIVGWLIEGLVLWQLLLILPNRIPYDVTLWEFRIMYILIGLMTWIIQNIFIPLIFPGRHYQVAQKVSHEG